MNAIDRLSDSSSALVHQARRTLAATSSHLPQWLEAGAVLSVAKTGTRAATTLVRRNPGIAVAIGVVGVGVLAYRFFRRRADAAQTHAPRAAISGKVSRNKTETDADGAAAAPTRKRAAAKRTRKAGTTGAQAEKPQE